MSDRPAASLPFDARPLVEPVDSAAVRAFARTLRAQRRMPGSFVGPGALLSIIVVVDPAGARRPIAGDASRSGSTDRAPAPAAIPVGVSARKW